MIVLYVSQKRKQHIHHVHMAQAIEAHIRALEAHTGAMDSQPGAVQRWAKLL